MLVLPENALRAFVVWSVEPSFKIINLKEICNWFMVLNHELIISKMQASSLKTEIINARSIFDFVILMKKLEINNVGKQRTEFFFFQRKQCFIIAD